MTRRISSTTSLIAAAGTAILIAGAAAPLGCPPAGRVLPPGISLIVYTNGHETDGEPDLLIPVGDPIEWTYVVGNTGLVSLTDLVVTDDQGVAVTCPETALEPGESMTCTASGTAVAGEYRNAATATGTPPAGSPVTASDAGGYMGVTPSISIEKWTDGDDADVPPGPSIAVGRRVEWTYVVENTGDVQLTDVLVTDDEAVIVTCPQTTLEPGESMICTGSGNVVAGQYSNVGTATATAIGRTVTASDTSHYRGVWPVRPSISLDKRTNGEDAAVPPGPSIFAGSTVQWTYVVSNTGNISLTNVAVTDDQGVAVTCPKTVLAAGESMTCTGSAMAVAGQYSNTAIATGKGGGHAVTAGDISHYLGLPPLIIIEKLLNGQDADLPPGMPVLPGSINQWTYLVTNTGDSTLTNVTVTDSDPVVVVACPKTVLAAGESMTCTASGIAVAAPYFNVGTATGLPPAGPPVSATDVSYCFGILPSIILQKLTNGDDANDPPGPLVPAGSQIQWAYVVRNTGNVVLANVIVTDNLGVAVTCPKTVLEPDESMTCTASGIAVPGQYFNLGIAMGVPPAGPPVAAGDVSHYFGMVPIIDLEALFNGEDADVPPGPSIGSYSGVEWTYVVTNTGNVLLTDVAVTDDQGVPVTCPKTDLQPGESMTCTGSWASLLGQCCSTSTATGTAGAIFAVTDTDPTCYLALSRGIWLTKRTNGVDTYFDPCPLIPVGSPITWTYEVANTGDIVMDVLVTDDDPSLTVSCPKSVLAPHESMTCTASGVAVGGFYWNLGSAEGTAPGGGQNGATYDSCYEGI